MANRHNGADRRLFVATETKSPPRKLKPERVGVRRRWIAADGVEWAELNDGSLWPLRSGDLKPDALVMAAPHLHRFAGRWGRVICLVPTWGRSQLVVNVAWEKRNDDQRCPGAFWRPEDLVVVSEAR